jgi:hypothetical protein
VKFLLFPRQNALLRHHEDVLLELVQRGHSLEVALPASLGEGVRPPLAGVEGIDEVQFDTGFDADTARMLRLVRLTGDYLRFLEPPLDTAFLNRERVREKIEDTRADGVLPIALPEAGDAPAIAAAKAQVARIENDAPPDPAVLDVIGASRPDVVLVTPLVSLGSPQTEVVKAARALGIPCGLLVFSWDNLSNKGVMAVIPDRVFVWNAIQRREAIELQGVPPESVVVTGAPRFDRFFEMRPSVTRAQLAAQHGLDPDKPIVAYLGSAPLISPDERVVADRWLRAVRASAHPRLRSAGVIVRPHPRQWRIWDEWPTATEPGVALSERPGLKSEQSLFDQLFHADAAVGLNTSAELEASILETPVFTFDAGDDGPGQQGTTHFSYLLKENGGVVNHAATLDANVRDLERAVDGDVDRDGIRAFVESFLRPAGLEQRAGLVMVGELEAWAAATAKP